MPLRIVPVGLREANAFVARLHRHSGATRGHKFSCGVEDDGVLRGVAIAGRPVARHLDDGRTLEVLRVCTDGVRNGCSILYGACRRAAFALGYVRVVTYTLDAESGASLHAAGFVPTASVSGRQWSCPSRPRAASVALDRVRWECARKG